MIIPCMALVINNCSSKASGRIDTSAGDGDGGQVNKEHCKSNRQGSKNLQETPQDISPTVDRNKELWWIMQVDQNIYAC